MCLELADDECSVVSQTGAFAAGMAACGARVSQAAKEGRAVSTRVDAHFGSGWCACSAYIWVPQ